MNQISSICGTLCIICLLAAPVALIIWIVALIRKSEKKKKAKWFFFGSLAGIILFTAIGTATSPMMRCEHEWETVEKAVPTCTESGASVMRCVLCEAEKTGETIPPVGHVWAETRKESTCESDGMIVSTCNECGIEETEIIPATGHTFEEKTVQEATCVSTGLVEKTCSVCNKVETITTEKTSHDYKATSAGAGEYICSVCGNIKPKEETADKPKEDVPAWQNGLSPELVEDIKQAFTEIGENPDYIESVEYVDTTETGLFYRRDYKVTFENATLATMFEHESWVHSRFYRITTQEWYDGEPEKELFPREYLAAIKFWTDGNNTNINQWAQNGSGVLQNSETTILPKPSKNNVKPAYALSIADLVKEIDKDAKAAGEKYNGQWVEITGTVTDISKSAGLTGYYIHGERSGHGLKIICWVYESDHKKLSVGDSATFIGVIREVSAAGNTELGYCEIIPK